MSGSISLASTPFTDAEKADIREFCWYPAYGQGASGFQSWRFFQAYGTLEYRLNNFAPAEIQKVRQYLGDLYPLRAAFLAASSNLGTDSASVWVHNKAELSDRMAQYRSWRLQLVLFIGVPPGPAYAGSGSRAIVI